MSRLDVFVTHLPGRPTRAGIGLAAWIAAAAPRTARGRLTVALVSDRAMRQLNGTHRGVDRATDVLSFPADEHRPRRRQGADLPPQCLGDIAVALGKAQQQARALGHSIKTEVKILTLHGLLHLLGYDHETDQGQMGRLEERLRRRAGLPVGLIARAQPAKRGRAR